MKALNQLKTFGRILSEYPGDTPLGKFLAGFYRQNKQMGSNDRRVASRLIYNYFRIGKALENYLPEERLVIAEFLCNNQINSFLQHFKPDWNAYISFSIDEKIALVKATYPTFKLTDVFPWHHELSAGIDQKQFLQSFFVQPDLYIRVLRGYEQQVKAILTAAEVAFKDEGNNCLSLPNGTRLENIFPNKYFFDVQDYSSQKTGDFFKPKKWDKWWDACAASGGKSLLLMQMQPDVKLVVSDIRESILANLHERFQQAGIMKYQTKLLDLTQNPDLEMHNYEFDGIILDAPCSGSGTWGRTPEMINQFSAQRIEFFSKLQRSILPNVVKYLKPGKPLIYITCSVFKAENEEVVSYMVDKLGLQIEEMSVLKGYERKADTMFVARLTLPE